MEIKRDYDLQRCYFFIAITFIFTPARFNVDEAPSQQRWACQK